MRHGVREGSDNPTARPAPATAAAPHLHGVDDDGEGRVVPEHVALFASSAGGPRLSSPRDLLPHSPPVQGVDAQDAEDHHECQKAHTHHDDDGGSTGDHFEERKREAVSRVCHRNMHFQPDVQELRFLGRPWVFGLCRNIS